MAHRIDTSGHVANQFSEGSPGVSPPTQVDKHWLNMAQEEIVNVVEEADITLVKGTNTQLKDAVIALNVSGYLRISTNGSGGFTVRESRNVDVGSITLVFDSIEFEWATPYPSYAPTTTGSSGTPHFYHWDGDGTTHSARFRNTAGADFNPLTTAGEFCIIAVGVYD